MTYIYPPHTRFIPSKNLCSVRLWDGDWPKEEIVLTKEEIVQNPRLSSVVPVVGSPELLGEREVGKKL